MVNFKTPPFAGVVAILILSACSSSSNTPAATSEISWESCIDIPSLDCSSIEVPLDYNDEDGEKINIGLRRRAADNAESTRLLLLNPGGPGAPGIRLLNDLVRQNQLPERIRENFNVVGFDPRGVGESGPVDCSEFGLSSQSSYPTDKEDISELVIATTNAANACSEKYGDYLLHLGTNNAASDMEAIRKASNADKLDFLGYSYGVRLGAVYLQNFPQTSGAFVLDGVLPPTSSASYLSSGSVTAMQRNLDELLAGCAELDEPCEPALLKQQLQARADYFVQVFESETLPPEFESADALEEEVDLLLYVLTVVGTEASLAEFALLPLVGYLQSYDSQFLEQFVEFLQMLQGSSSDEEDGLGDETATIAVQCADDAERPTVDSLYALLQDMNNSSDLYAETGISLAAICAGWPDAILPVEPISTDTAPQALLIGGTTDAQTPIEWLPEMTVAIGGISITSSHFGHTVVFTEASSCVDNQVIDFLVDQTSPVDFTC